MLSKGGTLQALDLLFFSLQLRFHPIIFLLQANDDARQEQKGSKCENKKVVHLVGFIGSNEVEVFQRAKDESNVSILICPSNRRNS